MAKDGLALGDEAQQELLTALRSGALREGQFVSMSQLVDLLGRPLAPVRDAVKQASAHGFLTTLPKRGIQVMEATPETIRACLDFRMTLDQEGARRRISTGNLGDLPTIRAHHEEIRDKAASTSGAGLPPQAIRVDLSLHDHLAAGLDNPLLSDAYEINRVRIQIIQNVRPFLHDRIVSAMTEHLAIIDALETRDTDAACKAIQTHCTHTLRWWGVT